MQNLIAGQNLEIQFPLTLTLTLEKDTPHDIDASVYLLKDNKASSDNDIVFYGQPASPDGKVTLEAQGRQTTKIVINGLPAGKDRIAITLASENANNKLTGAGTIKVEGNGFIAETNSDLAALIVAEVYERNGAHRIKIVAQGFDGGLAKLANHYGIEVEENTPAPAATPTPAPAKISLSKTEERTQRVISLAKNDPKIIDLTKKAAISLSKKGLGNETAKFALVLDISGSMANLFRSGAVDRLVQRVLAIGMTLDDDLSIDIFPFGINAHAYGGAGPESYKQVVPQVLQNYGLEGGTYYGKAMQAVRRHYRGESDFGKMPVYVMFVTDGGTQDPDVAAREMREASREGIFWQFMAIGDKSTTGGQGFAFLEALDNLSGRQVDNANFFSVKTPDTPTDEQLYDLMMTEYPSWLRDARAAGILR